MAKNHVIPSGRGDLDRQQGGRGHDEAVDQHGDLLIRRGQHGTGDLCDFKTTQFGQQLEGIRFVTNARQGLGHQAVLAAQLAIVDASTASHTGRHRNPGQRGQ